MNRRWLIILLLASWTFNVMLGVAYYLKSHYPTGGYWMAETLRPHHGLPPDESFDAAREAFQEKIEPVMDQRRQLFVRIADAFMADEIDSVELNHLSDSLDVVNSKFQRSHLLHLKEMHRHISSENRHRMARRLIRRFDRQQNYQGPRHRSDGVRGRHR